MRMYRSDQVNTKPWVLGSDPAVSEINLENPLDQSESNTGLRGAQRTLHKGPINSVDRTVKLFEDQVLVCCISSGEGE